MDMVAQDDLWASVGGAKAANTLVVVSGTPLIRLPISLKFPLAKKPIKVLIK